MTQPTRAEILNFIASSEPLEQTLARFPGLTREQVRALLREAALLMHAEEQGVPDEAPAPVRPPLRPPAPEPPPVRRGPGTSTTRTSERASSTAGVPATSSSAGVPPASPEPAEAPPGEPARKRLRLYSDGAARGNPGPAGAGAVLTRTDGTVIAKLGKYLGIQTNNYAEYTGLLIGLEAALRLGANEIEVIADSELLVRQLQGAYKVKSPGLKPLYEDARQLLKKFRRVDVRHVPREENKLADEMSNRAIDEKM